MLMTLQNLVKSIPQKNKDRLYTLILSQESNVNFMEMQ